MAARCPNASPKIIPSPTLTLARFASPTVTARTTACCSTMASFRRTTRTTILRSRKRRARAAPTSTLAPTSPLTLTLTLTSSTLTQDLILAVNEVTTLPSDALPALKSAGLMDASALFTFNVQGADGAALRLGRLLLHPAAAAATDAGNTPLASNLEGEVRLNA